MGDLDGQVILFLGDSSDAGAPAVRAVVAAGARVFIAETDARRLVALIAELGHNRADGLLADEVVPAVIEQAFDRAWQRFGPVDGAICAAALPLLSKQYDEAALLRLHKMQAYEFAMRMGFVLQCFSNHEQPGAILGMTTWPPGEVDPPRLIRQELLDTIHVFVYTAPARPEAARVNVNFVCTLGLGDEAARAFRSKAPPNDPADPTVTLPGAVVHLLTAPVTGTFVVVDVEA